MAHDDTAAQLDALFAAPVRVTVGGRCVAVRGVRLGELAEYLRLYDTRPAGDAAQDTPEAAAWSRGIVRMLSQLCGEPQAWIEALPEADLDALFAAMQEANRALFARPDARSGPRGGEKISWATAVAVLIEAGHRPADIERYTLTQVEHYMAAHARLAADRQIAALSIARAAAATEKGYRPFMRALESARTKLGK